MRAQAVERSSKWEVLEIWEQGGNSCLLIEDFGGTGLLGGEARARPRPGLQKVLRESQGRTSDSGNGFGWILGVRYNLRGANPFIRLQTQSQSYQRMDPALPMLLFPLASLRGENKQECAELPGSAQSADFPFNLPPTHGEVGLASSDRISLPISGQSSV